MFTFFYLFIRRPTISTLFPYTTLFRSVSQATTDVMSGRIAVFLPTLGGHIGNVTAGRMRALVVSGDRKSTRLNSSHPSISYAVFCLKKKNQLHLYILLRYLLVRRVCLI